jgi:subtilisin family serine protease
MNEFKQLLDSKLNEVKIIEDVKPNTVDWGIKAINADKVWRKTQGEGVKIAIIDTGIDVNHPDLKDNIKGAINMFDHTTDVTDDWFHGTAVAGIIAGSGKAGVKGVAPKAELYIAKVLDKNGNGSLANVMDGITFAINYEVDILCMSLGVTQKLPPILEERIKEAHRNGITIVCATGNRNTAVEYPAYYDEVIAVGGLNKDLERAEFSNYGWETDVVAPAVEILSTYPDGKYVKASGTSFSSPLVAGAIALLISYHRKKGKELTPDEIKTILTQEKEREIYTGYGIIDIRKLLG